MLWLVAVAVVVNLSALGTAAALARAGRVSRPVVIAIALAAAVSVAIALWSVRVLRDGFAAAANAVASERSALLARETAHAMDVALASLGIAAAALGVVVALALRRRALGDAREPS